jgi:hypothetical protein
MSVTAALLLLLVTGSGRSALPLVMLACATVGFLAWNWPPARIFMGDVGSGYLGYALGALAMWTVAEGWLTHWVWVILGGAFLADATVTLFVRARSRVAVAEAHRSTAYQRLSTKTLREAITAASGGSVTTTITIPKYTHLIGVTTRVTTLIGTGSGTTGYSVGDGTDPDLWGTITGTAVGTTTDAANFTSVAALGPAATDRTITLTATGGNFDGTGVIEVCAFYLRAEADSWLITKKSP